MSQKKNNVTVTDQPKSDRDSPKGSGGRTRFHPIIVGWDREVLAGLRRLGDTIKLGGDFHVGVVSVMTFFGMKGSDVACRKGIAPSERVALLEAFCERGAADHPHEDPMARCASHLGVSVASLYMTKAVVDAARRDPATFGPTLERMDATGRIERAYEKVQRVIGAATREAAGRLRLRASYLAADAEAFVQRIDTLKKEEPEVATTVGAEVGDVRQTLVGIEKNLKHLMGGRKRGR